MLLQQQVRSNSDFHSAVSFGWLSILQWRLFREEIKSKSHLRTLFWRYILHICKKIKPKDHFKLYSLKFVHCMSSLHHLFSSLCFQFCKCCLEKHLKSHYNFFKLCKTAKGGLFVGGFANNVEINRNLRNILLPLIQKTKTFK